MKQKQLHSLLIIITGLLLVVTAIPGAGMDTRVGVRISGESAGRLQSLGIPFETLIDYDAFLWGVLPKSELSRLDHFNIDHQVYDSPYTLSTVGGALDPLTSTPPSSLDQAAGSNPDQPGLYLVQFHGPTKDAWLAALEANGLSILQYLHPFTYIVWGTPANLQQNQTQPFIRWVGTYNLARSSQPEYRIEDSKPVLTRVIVYQGQNLIKLRKDLEALGAEWITQVENADPTFNLITVNIPRDRLEDAAALLGIYSLQPLPLDGGNRGELGNQLNAGNQDGAGRALPGYMNWLSMLGLSGNGVIIANVDSGIDGAHPDLVNRMLPCAGITCGGATSSVHGTHTAGIMAGDGSSGQTDSYGFLRGLGMAPGAGLIEQVYGSVWFEPNRMRILMQESIRNNAVISGNSWGPSATPRGYDYDTRLVDLGVRDADLDAPGNQPLSYILSIMNGNGGTSTQGTPDEAKNILTVGSTFLQGAGGSQDSRIDDLSPNSAHGPSLDGRNIPHLVAPGMYVDSTTPSASYALLGGTSMASPHVTGAVALFHEYYQTQFGSKPRPALVKAAFLPIAHDLAGNRDADGEILGHPFDSKQGWGRLNAGAVLNPSGEVWYFDQKTILDYSGASWSTTITTLRDSTELRAMLAWTDAAGHGNGGSIPAWVNDLDLSVTIDGRSYFGNQFGPDGYSIQGGIPDWRNNTEGVFLADVPPGDITFTITAANISGDGIPNVGDSTDQDFALVIYAQENEPEPVFKFIFPIFFQ